MSSRRLAAVIVLLLLHPRVAHAVDEHVAIVKGWGCGDALPHSQTGFRVRSEKGIYTALHGVAGCRQITATFRGIKEPLRNLQIRRVDIEKDMALLSSPELDGLAADGLEIAGGVDLNTLRTVRVVGHPFGIDVISLGLIVGDPAIRQLEGLVPPEIKERVRQRHSPALGIDVLSIQGPLVPGHSGAPILDARDRVVAVANGGLKGGTVGIGWGIPTSGISWERSEISRLAEISRLNPEILFSLDTHLHVGAYPSDIAQDEFHEAVLQFLEAANDGFLYIASEPVVGSVYYFARIGLPVEFLTPCRVDLRKIAVCPADIFALENEPHRQYADLFLRLNRSLQTWAVREYQAEIGGPFLRQQDWTDTRNGQTIRLSLERYWHPIVTGNPRAGRYADFRTVVYIYAPGFLN